MERYRFYPEGAVFFVTFTVVQWLPVFIAERACKIITDSLNFCHRTKGLCTNAYVIMPTHFHGVLFHESFDPRQLEHVVTDLRKFTGRQLCDLCQQSMPSCFIEAFRQASGEDRRHRFWQPSRHPELIETGAFCQNKIDYLHDNPCRKGLVTHAGYWRFSSASYWFADGQIDNDVIMSKLDW